jgi:hypothetical protein
MVKLQGEAAIYARFKLDFEGYKARHGIARIDFVEGPNQ